MKFLPGFTIHRLGSRAAAAAAALLCSAMVLLAAPFDNQIEYTQPDGATVRLHGKGDEFYAVFETLDGYTVVYDQSQKAYCYARLAADGQLISSGVQVQTQSGAALGLTRGLRMSAEARKRMVIERYQRWEQVMQTKARWEELKAANRARESVSPNGPQPAPPPFTTTGLKVGLCLLVDFSDDPSTVPQAEIIDFCNGDNYTGYGNNGSVKQYYFDNSAGLLTYTNVVTIYIRAPQPKTVYNDTTKDAGNQGNLLIKDIIDTMKALPDYTTTILPTFDPLTVDNNNQVIACNVFYAGGNGNVWSMGLWPHSWGLYVVGAQELSPGGKKVFRYQITNIGNTLAIGTFCHENGHMLCGYPDIYDYDYDSTGGAGMFCLMNSGGHGGNPVQICAYLKRASGWGVTTEVNTNSAMMGTLVAAPDPNQNHYYRFQKPGVPTEYFLLENRQQTARDARLPAAGIAIWHVDELGDRDNQSLAYNTSHANYECTLVQADNQWHFERNMNDGDSLDLFYLGNNAANYINEISDTTSPSARWWDGSFSGMLMADFSASDQTMTFRIGTGLVALKVASVAVADANGSGVIDNNECTDLFITLTNAGVLTATNVQVSLSTTTPETFLVQRSSAYPDVPGGGTAVNLSPFRISTSPEFICGTPIVLSAVIKAGQVFLTNTVSLVTGNPGIPVRFDTSALVPIPDRGSAASPLTVTNIITAINKVTVSLYIDHTWDSDLTLKLISPDGVTNTLSANNGGAGNNYGASCLSDPQRTVFDDDATIAIGNALPPFVGTFKPEEPLKVFAGKSGTNVNGTWLLYASDGVGGDVGNIRCWSLIVTPTQCIDGGGECPGAELAVGLTAQPEPVIIGGQLTYTISVTNNGPSSAKNVTISQLLPPNVVFVSATASQGSVPAPAGGVLTCNLGRINAGGRAWVTVVVLPVTPSTIFSTATVSSEQPDFNPDNNSASVTSHVNPPTADLAVGISASPASTLMGSTLTYTVAVTNNGPSTATEVTVTNVLPASAPVISTTVSQGSSSTAGNLVVCVFNSLTAGSRATATINVVPTAEGSITATTRATASTNLFDPILSNNSASVATFVGPSADVSVSVIDYPDPVVTGSNLTYSITVSNAGPSVATGVVMNHSLSSAVTVTSTSTTQGIVSQVGQVVIATLGAMPKGTTAVVTVVATPTADGTVSAVTAVSASQPDPVPANNNTSTTTVSDKPFVRYAAGEALLTDESFLPKNGAIDIGETVALDLRIRNTGNIGSRSNVVATLLATNGVTPIEPSTRNFGLLAPSAPAVFMSFSFVAQGTNGGPVTAVLHIQDGSYTTNVSFSFTLPRTTVFSNTNAIAIRDNDAALPYPSMISVSNLTGVLGKVTVTLSNLSHTFPQDVDALVAGPGASAPKSILMSGAGFSAENVNVTFDDNAAEPIPDGFTEINSGSYRPGSYLADTTLPAPAPAGPYPAALSVFNSANPNGVWSLFVADRSGGDLGVIAGGWSVAVTMLTPVNHLADLSLAGSVSPITVVAGQPLTYTFTVTNNSAVPANTVSFTNQVPAGVSLVSASCSSSGIVLTNGGLVSVYWPVLSAGSNATVTIVVVPSTGVVGTLSSTGHVVATETDLNLVNNTAVVQTPVTLPVADLVLVQTSTQTNVVLGSNFVSTLFVTNLGPGTALSSVVTNRLPSASAFVSATASTGTWAAYGNDVVWTIGNLLSNGTATISISASASATGNLTNVAWAATGSSDPVPGNNVAANVLASIMPAPVIVAAGAVLENESIAPPNGSLDPGEAVTISFALTNAGSADIATDLVATLQPGGGITSPSAAQSYGALVRNSSPVSRPFSFTASGVPGGTVTATLQLRDGTRDLGTVAFSFAVPTKVAFSSSTPITIPNRGVALPYPSTINVSGLAGAVGKVTVQLNGLSHTFPRDVSVLLVSPAGQTAVLMSRSGGGYAVSGVNLGFDDGASATLPNSSPIVSGTYKPGKHDQSILFPAPAPDKPYGSSLSALAGRDPNGTWALYVYDESTGDGGSIAGGWGLEITTVNTVNPLADLGVGLVTTPATFYLGASLTNTITVTNSGPDLAGSVFVTNTLPVGANFVSANPPGFVQSAANGKVVLNIGSLASGAVASCKVIVLPTLGGTLLNLARVAGPVADLNSDNNAAQTTADVYIPIPATISGQIVSGRFQLTIQGQPNLAYKIQTSAEMTNWSDLATATAGPSGTIKHTDMTTPAPNVRFYRTMQAP